MKKRLIALLTVCILITGGIVANAKNTEGKIYQTTAYGIAKEQKEKNIHPPIKNERKSIL